MAIVAGLFFLALGTALVVFSRRLADAYFRVWGRDASRRSTFERGLVISCLVAAGVAIGIISLYLLLTIG